MSSYALMAQGFITKWAVDEITNLSIGIGTQGNGYNYNVDWGDGSAIETGFTGPAYHTYSTAGTYTVEITGSYPRISIQSQPIISVDQWGTMQWTSMRNAFANSRLLEINATDIPDLSNVTDMSGMFNTIKNINQDIRNWDVSNVTNMGGMFSDAISFNQDLSNWDTSNVDRMHIMFADTGTFNQDLSSWDTSNVIMMHYMFAGAAAFNQDLSKWDVVKVANMDGMFFEAEVFDQNIGMWNIESLTTAKRMFRYKIIMPWPLSILVITALK